MLELDEKKIVGLGIRLQPSDNIVIARIDISIGQRVGSEKFISRSQVTNDHKIATKDIKAGDSIKKYNASTGFEHTLTLRAQSKKVGEKLIARFKWWKEDYSTGRDLQINGLVSPENQVGGLSNIFEKSFRSSMKGGTSSHMEEYKHAESVNQPGFVFMDTPGFDPVSATGQIAGGENLIMCTIGRGFMFDAKPLPSINLGTNTPMYTWFTEDLDVNCGVILDGVKTIKENAKRIFDLMVRVVSGEKTKSKLLGLGDHEFVPWNVGIMS